MFSDPAGRTTPNGGTIPINICITTSWPEITVIDKKNKTINIFEFTCPLELIIGKRNAKKMNKYAHFLKDITCMKPSYMFKDRF